MQNGKSVEMRILFYRKVGGGGAGDTKKGEGSIHIKPNMKVQELVCKTKL